jgi:hypothetical protein
MDEMKWKEMQLFVPDNNNNNNNIIIIIIIPSSTQSPLTHVGVPWFVSFFSLVHLMDEIQFGCLQYHPFNSITTNAFLDTTLIHVLFCFFP